MNWKKIVYVLFPIATIALMFWTYLSCKELISTDQEYTLHNSFTISAADKIEITDTEKKLVLTKNHTSWHLQEPFVWTINKYAIDRFLQLVYKIKTTKDITITLYRNNTKIYQVPTSPIVYNKTLQTLTDLNFWCKNLFSLSLVAIEILYNYDLVNEIEYVFNKINNKLALILPLHLPVNSTKTDALLSTLSKIDVEKFLWLNDSLKTKLKEHFTAVNTLRLISADIEHVLQIFVKQNSDQKYTYLQYNDYPILLKTRLNYKIFNAIMLCNDGCFSNIKFISIKNNDHQQILIDNTQMTPTGIIYTNEKIYDCNANQAQQILDIINKTESIDIIDCDKTKLDLMQELTLNINDENVFFIYACNEMYYLKSSLEDQYLIKIDTQIVHCMRNILSQY